jgi:hypothetical protein
MAAVWLEKGPFLVSMLGVADGSKVPQYEIDFVAELWKLR